MTLAAPPLLERARSHLTPEAGAHLRRWLEDPALAEFVPKIADLVAGGDWDELEDSFYTDVPVGTGGRRGRLGVGPNRINTRTVGESAEGLARFIASFGPEAIARGVVVGYDARRLSRELAEVTARVFAAHGIHCYLFDGVRSTPEVSFAIRHLGTQAGVVITASHNPRTDNGFKFYWDDGGQVVPPDDARFTEFLSAVDRVSLYESLAKAVEDGLATMVGREVDEAYLAQVAALAPHASRSAGIMFSAVHGVGATNVLPALERLGFQVQVVPEHLHPDSEFPTFPDGVINPEYPSVMRLAVERAAAAGCDLAIVADPDADRVGVAARRSLSSPQMALLDGNQVGALLAHFVLSRLREQNAIPVGATVVTTAVTTSLIGDIARAFGVRAVEHLPVGFKFIGRTIKELPDPSAYVFGCEESLGYLRGTYARDKDAASAAVLLAAMASYLKDSGRTVLDELDEIYRRYGYYRNRLRMDEYPGRDGLEAINRIMAGLRAHPPERLGGLPVVRAVDWREPNDLNPRDRSDMFTLLLSEDGRSRATARPSGTEPKIKYYIQHYAPPGSVRLSRISPAEGGSEWLEAARQRVDGEAQAIEEDLLREAARILAG